MARKITLVLDEDLARALLSSFDSADRGREDFEYLARQDNGDYSQDDIARTREQHRAQIVAETAIRRMIELGAQPPVCANCHEYAGADARIIQRAGEWVHISTDEARCPGQGEDDTDDVAEPLIIDGVTITTVSD